MGRSGSEVPERDELAETFRKIGEAAGRAWNEAMASCPRCGSLVPAELLDPCAFAAFMGGKLTAFHMQRLVPAPGDSGESE